MKLELHQYQIKAAQELANRYIDYQNRPNKPKTKEDKEIPIILTLASITGSGKTAMLTQTVSNIFDYYINVKPIIFWLSYYKVVIEQTLYKLSDKYKSLLLTAEIKSFVDISSRDIEEVNVPLVYVDTVQKFNAHSEEDRRIYKVEEDSENQSKWNLIINRTTKEDIKRPLVIVYDESQNLSNQQIDKILELNPQGMILASGTPIYSTKLGSYIKQLKALDYKLETMVPIWDVKSKQMIKHTVALGSYNLSMEHTINEILQKDLKKLTESAQDYGLDSPKVIYVCKTNLKNTGEKDDLEIPFEQRNAPPILIWRYLRSQGIPADKIVVYANVDVSKDERFALDSNFKRNLFGSKSSPKENTYEKFVQSNYQHIIFNKALKVGWDDPAVYIAYIDKTMHSDVDVEQVIGRVLRQPQCRYYESEELNKAYFHIRVDEDKTFRKILSELGERLKDDDSRIEIREEKLIDKIDIPPKGTKKVPFLSWETEHIISKLQSVVDSIPDYNNYPEKTLNKGTREWTEYKLGDSSVVQPEIRREKLSYTNKVRARVVLRRAIIDKNSRVWNIVEDWVAKFDALIGWGSEADHELRNYANQLVGTYLNEAILKVRLNEPYQVRKIKVEREEEKCHNFKNALHDKYSNLNGLEIKTAYSLDGLGKDWCRNPTFSGYGIELIDEGSTSTFYPDFLLWTNDDTVICLEVTGEHLEKDKLERKLVRIYEPMAEMVDEAPRNIYVIVIVQCGNPLKGEEIYFRVWYRKRKFEEITNIEVKSISEAIRVMLSDCL